jgi:hypothetical protein
MKARIVQAILILILFVVGCALFYNGSNGSNETTTSENP